MSSAGQFNVSIDQTIHVGARGEYNNTHPMVEYVTDDSWVGGAYYNSEKRVSVFGGKRFNINKFSVDIGLVAGYKSFPVLPALQVQYHCTEHVKFFLFPSIEIDGNKKRFMSVVGVRYIF